MLLHSQLYVESIEKYFQSFGPVFNVTSFKAQKSHGVKVIQYFYSLRLLVANISKHLFASSVQAASRHPNWYISFVKAEDAARALAKGEHYLDGKKIKVEAAEGWLQFQRADPAARLRTLAQQSSNSTSTNGGRHIQTLKMTDLIKICNYLQLADLCSFADTCVAANQAANEVFERKFSKLVFTFAMDGKSALNARALAIFSPFVKDVTVSCYGQVRNQYEYDLVSEYYHELINIYGEHLKSLEWPQKRMPHEKQFTNLMNLTEMSIDCRGESALAAITNMECLKWVLKLTVAAGSINKTFYKRLSKLINLRVLHLDRMKDQPNLSDLAVLKELESVKIDGRCKIGERILANFVQSLPKLVLLEFEESNASLQEKTYLKLVDIYRKRGNKLILRNYDYAQCDISKSQLAENKRYVEFFGGESPFW